MHSWRTRTVCKFLARAAKRSVLWLSSVCQFAGVTLHTIVDRALPPSEFCRMRVIFDERYLPLGRVGRERAASSRVRDGSARRTGRGRRRPSKVLLRASG